MRRASATLVALIALAATRPAGAEIRIAPADDGGVGAWLVAGPLTPSTPLPAEVAEGRALADHTRAKVRLALWPGGALDLAKFLGVGDRAGPRAALVADLDLAEQLNAWLLVSCDGGLQVTLDGHAVFSRSEARLRGSSWDAIAISAAPGRHRVVLDLTHTGRWWAVETRLLDRARLIAPPGAVWVVPARLDDADVVERLVAARATLRATPQGLVPLVSVALARGRPLARLPISVRLGETRYALGDANALGRSEITAQLPHVSSPERVARLALELLVGTARRTVSVAVSRDADDAARAAWARLRAAPPLAALGQATLTYDLHALERAASGAEPAALQRATIALRRDLDDVGRVDFATRPGIRELALPAGPGADPDRVIVHVPSSYRADGARRYPLTVVLHGLDSTPERVLAAFLDQRLSGARGDVDGVVIAPHARGNAFYRGIGERAVLDAVTWALATYAIDPDRVSITGASMGGTGTAHIALRYAERFSSASPLCGYHSFFIRRDTQGRNLRPWERDVMAHFSPASWAAAGRNLPLYVAQGTLDFPLENSKVLIEAYRRLGYAVTDEWPEIGHNVHEKVWSGAHMWPWLAGKRRDTSPKRVTIATDVLRYGRQHWARITDLERVGGMARLDATATTASHVRVETDGVRAFELTRGTRLTAEGEVMVEVGGSELKFTGAIAAHHDGARWLPGPAEGARRAGVEGPVADVFLSPVRIVYGAGSRATARANREIAEWLARRHGVDAGLQVVADFEATPPAPGVASVLVGTPEDHAELRAFAERLPLRVSGGALIAGTRRYDQPGTGALFVHPDPRDPDQVMLVVTGVDAAGIWRAASLPALLPEYLVYGPDLAPAAAEQVLGAARIHEGGWLARDWTCPTQAQ